MYALPERSAEERMSSRRELGEDCEWSKEPEGDALPLAFTADVGNALALMSICTEDEDTVPVGTLPKSFKLSIEELEEKLRDVQTRGQKVLDEYEPFRIAHEQALRSNDQGKLFRISMNRDFRRLRRPAWEIKQRIAELKRALQYVEAKERKKKQRAELGVTNEIKKRGTESDVMNEVKRHVDSLKARPRLMGRELPSLPPPKAGSGAAPGPPLPSRLPSQQSSNTSAPQDMPDPSSWSPPPMQRRSSSRSVLQDMPDPWDWSSPPMQRRRSSRSVLQDMPDPYKY